MYLNKKFGSRSGLNNTVNVKLNEIILSTEKYDNERNVRIIQVITVKSIKPPWIILSMLGPHCRRVSRSSLVPENAKCGAVLLKTTSECLDVRHASCSLHNGRYYNALMMQAPVPHSKTFCWPQRAMWLMDVYGFVPPTVPVHVPWAMSRSQPTPPVAYPLSSNHPLSVCEQSIRKSTFQ